MPRGEGAREQVLFRLVEAALNQKADGWVGTATSAVGLRTLLLSGAGDATIDDAPEPVPLGLIVGVVVGAVAVVSGVGLGVAAVLNNEGNKDKGFTYAVDASAF